jgi:hypothetical protein
VGGSTRHPGARRCEYHADGELPAGAEIALECNDRVQVVGWGERAVGLLDSADAVDPVAANGAGAVGAAQQIPAAVADDDGPGVDLLLPCAAGAAAIADVNPAPRRHGEHESARHGGFRMDGVAVWCRGGMLGQRRGLLGEHDRWQPGSTTEPVAAVASPGGLDGNAGLAQDRDVSAGRPLGDAEPLGDVPRGHARASQAIHASVQAAE